MSEQPARIEGIQPGLQARGLDTGGPVADWLCACGEHERATGKAAVEQLLARVRVGHCPHRPAEGRAAA
ncbi:hypothetical protein [Streptomyces sp. NBC_00483]|uniref:hypothetical protein n=1 Tax=Streptomyces sp. NBC_00483 TaxID=2975756 RepID=UPI002E1914EF